MSFHQVKGKLLSLWERHATILGGGAGSGQGVVSRLRLPLSLFMHKQIREIRE